MRAILALNWLTVAAKKLFVVFDRILNMPHKSFVSVIILAIDDFNSNSWFEWKNHNEKSKKVSAKMSSDPYSEL